MTNGGNDTTRRMNPGDVPGDVYAALASGAAANHQSLNAFVLENLTEVAQVPDIADCLAACEPPSGTGVVLEDATAAVRQVRDAS